VPISPIVPVSLATPSSVYSEPSASQLSSISHRLCLSQNSFTFFKSNGFPRVWAIITAFVLLDSALSSIVTSMLYCGIVISTNTGIAPYCTAGVTVVGNPAATVIISSPGFTCRLPKRGDVKAMNASRFAEEPEFTREQYRMPR
jgi:hypothetical protein